MAKSKWNERFYIVCVTTDDPMNDADTIEAITAQLNEYGDTAATAQRIKPRDVARFVEVDNTDPKFFGWGIKR